MRYKIGKIKLYTKLSNVMPKDYRKWIEQYLIYAGIQIPPETYIGFTILYAISVTYASLLFIFTRLLPPTYALFFPFVVSSLFIAFMHAILIVIADSRTKLVEELLPDVLRLIAANLRSGLTIDRALLVSARPEFGPLEKKLNIASKETLSGITIDKSLLDISDTFNSKILKRSVELLSEGLKRGGDLAKLLESLSDDIIQIKILRKDVHAMVMMYVIFIFFAAGIGAPLLYSISGFLVSTMAEIGVSIGTEEALPTFRGAGTMPLSVPRLTQLDPQFLDTYSFIALTITSIFGGLLIGLVQEGSERAGIRFMPLLFMVSITIYYISKFVISTAFGGLTI